MILELVSKNEGDVWASVYTNKNKVNNLLLKSGDNKKIVIDNPTETIEVRFNERISLLRNIFSAILELICQFVDYHEKVLDLVNCNFITTQIEVSNACETVKVEYDTKYFQNAMRDAKIGTVDAENCKSRYLFDRECFGELNRNDRIQVLFAGLISSVLFVLLFMRYFSIYSIWTCMFLLFLIVFIYMFFTLRKKKQEMCS